MRTKTLAAASIAVALAAACTSHSPGPVQLQGRAKTPPPPPHALVHAEHVYYLNPSGDDAANGSLHAPWRTFVGALPRLRAGDRLIVAGGDYRQLVTNVVLHKGRPLHRIIVTAAAGARPVIHGLVWLRDPSYWTFRGINVTWDPQHATSTDHMVKITNGVRWVWSGSEIWGAQSPSDILVVGDRPGRPARWRLIRNCIHDTLPANGPSQNNNIYIGSMTKPGPGLIEDNLVFGATNGRNIKLGAGQPAPGTGPSNILVRGNTFADARVPIVISGGAHDITIERNVIAGSKSGYLIRGYQLSGAGDIVAANIGTASAFIAPGSAPLIDAGNNRLVAADVLRGPASCSGLRTISSFSGYGVQAQASQASAAISTNGPR